MLLMMRRLVILTLVLTLKVAVSLESKHDRNKYSYAEDSTHFLSRADHGNLKEQCKQLAYEASPNFVQRILGWFGTTGALAATYIAPRSQISAAMNYTKLCSHPKYGRIDATILLTKWNSDGSFIYPDTKWCGAGNVSNGTGDYGPARATDICCEIHDNATDYILASGYHVNHTGLSNPRRHTVTNCEDDMELYNCLYNDNSTNVSLQFGQAFFDALQVPCFIETYPKVCKRWSGWWFWASCLEYELDKNQAKQWQFFYAPNFYDAFVAKWYKDDKEVQRQPVDGPADSWSLFCDNDNVADCSKYEFMNNVKQH